MAEPLAHWQRRIKAAGILGLDTTHLITLTEARQQELIPFLKTDRPPIIFLVESDPLPFLAGFIAACTTGCPLFLCNPTWGNTEWQQVFSFIQPDLIWGKLHPPLTHSPITHSPFPITPHPTPHTLIPNPNWIMIPTGGSSGHIRFAIHTWSTLMASVQGFRDYFQIDRVHSCCVLPLYHVSGLMQFLRCFISEGQLTIGSCRDLEHQIAAIDPSEFVLSLVPTQLQRLLHQPHLISQLSRFRAVLLGGAPAWPALLEAARCHRLPLAPTYGMTETASQVATLKPVDFLQGQTGCGAVLPHAQIEIRHAQGDRLPPEQIGRVHIQAKSLALGYYPDGLFHALGFPTDDLGYFDRQGYLHIVGRHSQKIITGGENVFPIEVESVLRATQLVQDVCVIGLPDAEWGEQVTALYVPATSTISESCLRDAIAPHLSKFKHPKRWIAVPQLPRNAQGKLNYDQIRQLATLTTPPVE